MNTQTNKRRNQETLEQLNHQTYYQTNNQSQTLNTIAGTGRIDLGTAGYLGLGVYSGSSTFSGSVTGTGTIEKLGSGTFTLGSDISYGGTFLLGGGTLNLGGNDLIVDTLRITGNSVIDFGSAVASTLSVVNFIIDAGVNLTITNWTETMDYFFTQYWAGAVFNTPGAAPMNQITFSGFSGSDTRWQDFDSQITPVPEPATYGAMLVGAMGVFFAWRRWRQTKSAA
jgi:autotransporter-associated beta strand protein